MDKEGLSSMDILNMILPPRDLTGKRTFNRLTTSNLYAEIFTFLHLSNAKSLFYVNRSFLKLLRKNNERVLKLIGNYTYGLNTRQDFDHTPLSQFTVRQVKSNMYPIVYFALCGNVDLMATSPGPYYTENKLWSVSKGLYHCTIDTSSLGTEKMYCRGMLYLESQKTLIMAFDTGIMAGYDLSSRKGDKVKWHLKFANGDRLSFITEIQDEFLTIEQEEDIMINFIKTWSPNGKLIKKAILINEKITCVKGFNVSRKPYLAIGTDNGVIYTLIQERLEDNFNNLADYREIQGPITDVNQVLFISEGESYFLIVGYEVAGIYIWDITKYLEGYEASLINRFQDESHYDTITGLVHLGGRNFASCSNDREVIIWNFSQLITRLKYHTSSIFHIEKFNNELITTCYDKNIRAIHLSSDLTQIESIRVINAHCANVKTYQIDFLNKVLITVSVDKIMKYWSFKEIELSKTVLLGKEFCDGLIILNDDRNSIVKVDLTANIKFLDMKIQGDEVNRVYHTIKEQNRAICILNLLDGISFVVGFKNSEIAVYNYSTADGKCKVRKRKSFLHSDNKVNVSKLQLVNEQKQRFLISGASDGSIGIFNLETFERIRLIEWQFETAEKSEVVEICPLIVNPLQVIVGFVFSKGDFAVYDIKGESFPKMMYFPGMVSSVDRLNDDYFCVAYKDYNRIDIVDLTGNILRQIHVTFKNVRPLIYLRDGFRILALGGSPTDGYGFDLITFTYF